MSSNALPGDPLPPPRRGPHPLAALAAFVSLVLVAVTIIFGITSLGRLAEGMF